MGSVTQGVRQVGNTLGQRQQALAGGPGGVRINDLVGGVGNTLGNTRGALAMPSASAPPPVATPAPAAMPNVGTLQAGIQGNLAGAPGAQSVADIIRQIRAIQGF